MAPIGFNIAAQRCNFKSSSLVDHCHRAMFNACWVNRKAGTARQLHHITGAKSRRQIHIADGFFQQRIAHGAAGNTRYAARVEHRQNSL